MDSSLADANFGSLHMTIRLALILSFLRSKSFIFDKNKENHLFRLLEIRNLEIHFSINEHLLNILAKKQLNEIMKKN
jgi:hypothetical protein